MKIKFSGSEIDIQTALLREWNDTNDHQQPNRHDRALLLIAFAVLEVEDELEQIRLTLAHVFPPPPKAAVKLQFRLGQATQQNKK